MTGKTIVVQNGLYTIRIEMRDAKRSYATGVIVLCDGRILGGDTYFYYTGSYTFKDGKCDHCVIPRGFSHPSGNYIARESNG